MIGIIRNHTSICWKGTWVITLILVVFAINAWGQERFFVTASVDKDTIYIGDLITYTLTITHAPEVSFQPPPPAANLGQFEVRDYQVLPDEELRDGHLHSRVRWLISTFTTGDLQIPPAQIVYTDSAGQADTVSASAISIAVESLHPSMDGDIRDIKPPASLPGDRIWIYWLAAGLILAAAGTALFLRLRKRKMRRDLRTIEYQGPPRPAHEIALEELERIASLNLVHRGLIKQFYTEICEVIKRYIARRYSIQTMELTTMELMAEMNRASLPEEHSGLFGPFFEECDLVKFAKHVPVEQQINGALDEARRLISATKNEPLVAISEIPVSATPVIVGKGENSPEE